MKKVRSVLQPKTQAIWQRFPVREFPGLFGTPSFNQVSVPVPAFLLTTFFFSDEENWVCLNYKQKRPLSFVFYDKLFLLRLMARNS